MQAVALWRKRAAVTKLILELRGYGWIIKEVVRPKYPNFGKANGKAFDHNSEGFALALETLKQHDAELCQQIKDVLEIRR